jgi:hypothetical protein
MEARSQEILTDFEQGFIINEEIELVSKVLQQGQVSDRILVLRTVCASTS